MSFISLDNAKKYLRVDSSDEDALIGILLDSAFSLCADVARLTTDEREQLLDGVEVDGIYDLMQIAVYFSLAYLYEHREEADHTQLALTLRSLLFSVREGVF